MKLVKRSGESGPTVRLERTGHSLLWCWFGLDRASWLTMPRVMMHEMPDDWQRRMADLLIEWDATWDSSAMPSPHVSAKRNGKFTRWPEWLLNYRHPQLDKINSLRSSNTKEQI
jgi:hypothetical protein